MFRACRFFHVVTAFLLALLISSAATVFGQTGEVSKKVDALIIYSSGNVPPEGKTDAVTTPTPAKENMKTVSKKLEKALLAKKLTVRLASVSEKVTPQDILASGIVVMGSPSYWSNVSWQMKRYFDEQFIAFHRMEGHLKKTKAAAFSMAAWEPNASSTIEIIRTLITQNDGVFGPTMIILVPGSPEETQKRVEKFADDIAAFLR